QQVSLVLRYHFAATLLWISDLKQPGGKRGQSALAASIQALKWLVPIIAFVWWRRRADRSLSLLSEALHDPRAHRASRSNLGATLIEYVRQIRSPLEWLLLVWAVITLLPPDAAGLLEVQLLRKIFVWTLGGALVVETIDFLAGREARRHARSSQLHTAHLRLRSLRLIGAVVVTFGLMLALSSELVGRGTIYGWTWGFCWFAAVPVLLTIVRW